MIFFFLDFGPNKSKVFDILVIKSFKQNFGYFRSLLDFFNDFFYFSIFKNEIFNVLFFTFKSKVLYLLSQNKITLNMSLKDIFVVFQPYIF